jgi:hypothetical protein
MTPDEVQAMFAAKDEARAMRAWQDRDPGDEQPETPNVVLDGADIAILMMLGSEPGECQ